MQCICVLPVLIKSFQLICILISPGVIINQSSKFNCKVLIFIRKFYSFCKSRSLFRNSISKFIIQSSKALIKNLYICYNNRYFHHIIFHFARKETIISFISAKKQFSVLIKRRVLNKEIILQTIGCCVNTETRFFKVLFNT